MLKEINSTDWNEKYHANMQQEVIESLERGKIILLPQLSFQLYPHEQKFLSPLFSDVRSKNISFDAKRGLRGTKCKGKDYDDLAQMMKRFVANTQQLMQGLFPHYTQSIQVGRTSFRPVEILGRQPASYRKDDTRLHVDAFPTSPTQGKRILRVFTNIHPQGKPRHWRVGEPFMQVAKQFLPKTRRPWFGRAAIFKALGITKSVCTEYDYLMLQIHNQMKADLAYQRSAAQKDLYLYPGSTWIVQTDHVSHAAMSGQYLLEQTYYLPVEAMLNPDLSPLRTLEKLTGRMLGLADKAIEKSSI